MKGIVFNIERFALHDGHGIRTLIFMKGCPLRCRWCANPEGWDSTPQLMIFSTKCTHCMECIKYCPVGAITSNENGEIKTNRGVCLNCGKCTEVCYSGARVLCGKYMTVDEVFDEIIKDLPFYQDSGGGVTISGGECTVQYIFIKKLLKRCKDHGIHTAIETSGYVSWRSFKNLLEFIDLVLYDIKHMDSEKHNSMTGVSNKLILSNLTKLTQIKKQIIIRVPLIEKYNTSMEDVIAILNLMKSLNLREIHFLPYHKLGLHKYKALGYNLKIKEFKAPSKYTLQRVKELSESFGLVVRING